MYPRPRNAGERFASRAHYMPKDARSVLEHSNGSTVYVYETAGRFYAVFFWGTSGKPTNHYRYRSEAERDKAIWEFRESVERSAAFKTELRVKRQTAVCTLKPGDIVNTSWGYDQTNIDFYVITRATAKMVWVRPVAKDREQTGFMSGRCWPKVPIEFTGPETKHRANGNDFSIDGHHAGLTTADRYESWYA